MKHLILALTAICALNTWAADLTQEMDALGANRELMKKARAIDPNNKVRVVQNREVSRTMRLEFGLNYGTVAGGDTYLNSNMIGGQLDFHVTPHWSVGARYYDVSNTLSSEGKDVFDDAQARKRAGDTNYRDPGIDYAKSTWLTVVNWYPIYGKMSLFESAVSQFDIYLLGGAGQSRLGSGFTTPVYTAGGGVGLWLTKHISTRLEARWQGFKDHPDHINTANQRDVNQTILTATVGFLL